MIRRLLQLLFIIFRSNNTKMFYYKEIIINEYNGMLASSDAEWYNSIEQIIDNPNLYKKISEYFISSTKIMNCKLIDIFLMLYHYICQSNYDKK